MITPTVADLERSAKYHLAASVVSIIFLLLLFLSVVLFGLKLINPIIFWYLRLLVAILAIGVTLSYSNSGNQPKASEWLACVAIVVASLALF